MTHATELDRKNTLYRNNLATVLVDQGKLHEAFAHLRAVHTAGAAYYNMGYLLYKKGSDAGGVTALYTGPTGRSLA